LFRNARCRKASVSDPSGVTYPIQIDDNVDFNFPVYYAINLVDNAYTLPDENALALFIQYFWRQNRRYYY